MRGYVDSKKMVVVVLRMEQKLGSALIRAVEGTTEGTNDGARDGSKLSPFDGSSDRTSDGDALGATVLVVGAAEGLSGGSFDRSVGSKLGSQGNLLRSNTEQLRYIASLASL